MKSTDARLLLVGFVVLVATMIASGCDWDGLREKSRPNEKPTVRITGGAAEGDDDDYRVEFFWFGSDPDGTVSHFVYAIDDTCMCTYEAEVDGEIVEVKGNSVQECLDAGVEPKYEDPDSIWTRIDGFSGAFNFKASTELPAQTDPPLSEDPHVFFIKAVDDKGMESDVDRRGFTAQTIAPDVRIVAPVGEGSEQSQTVSTFVTIRWFGRDDDSARPDKKPIGYQLKMVRLGNIFETEPTVLGRIRNRFLCEDNTNVLIPDSLITFEPDSVDDVIYQNCDWFPKVTEPYEEESLQLQNVQGGSYAFAVRPVDIAGAVMPDRVFDIATEEDAGNVVKLFVSPNVPVNPIITMRERNFLGQRQFQASSTWDVQVPVNVPLRFEWDVDASWYGSRVGGVNFALDIPDPGCEVCQSSDGVGGWVGWGSHPGVPFDIIFSAEDAGARHLLYVRARDDSFSPAREIVAVVQMDVIAFSFDKTALLIDDFKTSGVNDCTHDELIRGVTGHAIEPYLQQGETMDRFNTYATIGDCGEGTSPGLIELETLARYKLLYWNLGPTSGNSLMQQLTNRPDNSFPTGAQKYLSIFMRAGGNLIVWGLGTAGEMLGGFYPTNAYNPEIPLYTGVSNFGPGTFVWDILRIQTQIDRVQRGTSQQLGFRCAGPIGMRPTQKAIDEGLPIGVFDPTGFDTTNSDDYAAEGRGWWMNIYSGHRNIGGTTGAVTLTLPSLTVSGMDTLYTHITNSWSWRPADENGVFDPDCAPDPDCNEGEGLIEVCGGGFLSKFEGAPAVLRFKDPEGRQGRWVWGMGPLYLYSNDHVEDLKNFMRAMTDWIFE